MSDSYNKIFKVAEALFEVSLELRDIDMGLSNDYLKQAEDFMSIIPEDKAYFPEEEKDQFKQLLTA